MSLFDSRITDYIKRNGSCNVPFYYYEYDSALFNWYKYKCDEFCMGRISVTSVSEMIKKGFCFNARVGHRKAWIDFCIKLSNFYEENGHYCIQLPIPPSLLHKRTKREEDLRELRWFADSQRHLHEAKMITKYAQSILDKIKFTWNPQQADFDMMVRELLNYKKRHGNVLVGRSNPHLKDFLKDIFNKNNQNRLKHKQKRVLQSLGVVFFK